MKNMDYNNLIRNLPDAFAKDKNSNNFKLLQISKVATDKIFYNLKNIFNSINMDMAYGYTMDLWHGEKVQLKRGQANDSQYLIRLKGKAMQNISCGTFEMMINALAFVLQCNVNDIHIIENEKENAVIIKDIPLETLLHADFTPEQVIEIVGKLLPANVTVKEYGFTGTFEFGEDYEYDAMKGFSDLENSVGGYLGLYGG